MSDVSKHIRLGYGITAEFMEGTVVLFRIHKDPHKIPGDIAAAHIARESPDGYLELIDTSGTDATLIVHQEVEGDPHEFKAYTGRMGTLSQLRVIQRFLGQIGLGEGVIQRHKNERGSHIKRTGKQRR